ncbi:MAG: hypothetical protein ACJ74G_03835 [Blastocatellia bacterium]
MVRNNACVVSFSSIRGVRPSSPIIRGDKLPPVGGHFAARSGEFTDFMAINDEIRWVRPLTPAVYKASRVHRPASFVASLQLAAYAKIQSEIESGGWQHSQGWREPAALKVQTNG